MPVFGSEIEQVKIGCLAAMGLDYVELGKQTGEMAAKVLKGEAKASELNFETIKDAAFYGNTKVAENLGITLPESLTGNAAELLTALQSTFSRTQVLEEHHTTIIFGILKKALYMPSWLWAFTSLIRSWTSRICL
ncbi:MAG: ABC transporter substrate binding protein [Clostridium sp.]